MLDRLKMLRSLSKYSNTELEYLQRAMRMLDDKHVDAPAVDLSKMTLAIYGNGKAEFLPDMTEAEVLAYERNERLGWKNFKMPWKDDTPTT